jgi:hypothetical protein
MYSVDWAIKKQFQIYNVEKNELTSISPTGEAFEDFFSKIPGLDSFYIEYGGGDIFKLMALKYGHRVFTILGKKVKEEREKLELPESDENSAKVIGVLAKTHLEEFYEFQESDVLTLKISLLYREYEKIVEDRTQKKNQLFAMKRRLQLLTSEKEVKKMIKKRKDTITALDKEVYAIQRQLSKLLEEHPLWVGYLKNIKGVGIVIAAGLIGSIGRIKRFHSWDGFRHFAGMMPRETSKNYSHHLKKVLYYFVEEIIKNRTPMWRKMYDDAKEEYKKKHPDWIKGKIDAYAKKFVQTEFLYSIYKYAKSLA